MNARGDDGTGSELRHSTALLDVFATLADTLVDDYDVVDLLQILVDASVDLLDVQASGILLADPHGDLELIASTSESGRLVELIQLSADEGPCIDSFRAATPVSIPEIASVASDWPCTGGGRLPATTMSQRSSARIARPLPNAPGRCLPALRD